jgi:predicted GH43/DUF377 family glycosyl hydrolase
MEWVKKGVIFSLDENITDMQSHSAIPFSDVKKDGNFRIYFSSRNSKGQSLPYWVDVQASDPFQIIKLNKSPLLELGPIGSFDDSGIMPSCVVDNEGLKYMYYIAWNPQVTVSYRLSIGLAISEDEGESYKKYSLGPICDRGLNEPYFNTAPFVLKEGNLWKMWFISCTSWELVNNYPEPRYLIKYAESKDGINWNKFEKPCFLYDNSTQAIGRPSIYKDNGKYIMFYSYRDIVDYRTDRSKSYRIGYAESVDGFTWERMDKSVGIDCSNNPNDWDYEMIEYCHVIDVGEKKLMFYNGNGFGKSGIGLAILKYGKN